MANITIGTSTISEKDGLYSLNDLHKAAGGEPKHRPNYFLENDQTKALIAEILKAGNPASKTTRGRYASTYVCRELVIAYAAWISAEFHLRVIRVFLDAHTAKPVPPLPRPRNVLKGTVDSITITMRVKSGDVSFALRIPVENYAQHQFKQGDRIEMLFAEGATPLATPPVDVYRVTAN